MTCPLCEGPDGVRWVAAENRELVVYGPDHAATLATDARAVIDLWAARTAAIGARPEVSYVLVTDATPTGDAHPCGEIYAFAGVPPTPLAELNAVPCPLCMEDPGDRLVSDGLGWHAWTPAHSRHPYEVVLAPMGHRPDLPSLVDWERDALAQLLVNVVRRFEQAQLPYCLWVHQKPCDERDWRNAHLHVEITAPPPPPSAAELGSGVSFNPIAPAEAAAKLRSAAEDPPTP